MPAEKRMTLFTCTWRPQTEAGHERNLQLKIRCIEDLDAERA